MSLYNKVINKLHSKNIGFSIDEQMIGHHEFISGHGPMGKQPFSFNVKWGPKNIVDWASPNSSTFLFNQMTGVVNIGGLADNIPIIGSLEINYFKEQKIRYTYDLEFEGKNYLFIGEKVNIRLYNLTTSHTTCFGTLTNQETGELISRSITYFRLKDSLRFLGSLRINK